jgi:hypothetical protein
MERTQGRRGIYNQSVQAMCQGTNRSTWYNPGLSSQTSSTSVLITHCKRLASLKNTGVVAVSNVTFVNMDNRNCYVGGAAGWDNRQGEVIPVSSRVNRTTFVNTTANQFAWINYAKAFTYAANPKHAHLSSLPFMFTQCPV